MKYFLIILIAGFIPLRFLYADTEENLEYIFEKIGLSSEESPILDEIEFLMSYRIDLKSADADEIMNVPYISLNQANIITRIARSAKNLNFKMLADSARLSSIQLEILKLCTKFESGRKSVLAESRFRLKSQFSPIKGFADSTYPGSKEGFYQRYMFEINNLSAGVILNKNPGEPKVIDFAGGYLAANLDGYKIIAGNFTSEFGMGSILGSSFGLRKGSEVISPALQYNFGSKPSVSTLGNTVYQGVTAAKSFIINDNALFSASLGFAYSPRSGSIDSLGRIASFYNLGLFRSSAEQLRKNTFIEKSVISAVEFKYSALRIGANAFYLDYSRTNLSTSETVLRSQNGFLSSLYAYYIQDDYSLGAETARDPFNNYSVQAGCQFKRSNFSAAINYRFFSADFNSPYGYMFGETYNPRNQSGLYLGLRYKINENWSLAGYTDFYTSLKPTASLVFPSRGNDGFLQSEYNFSEQNRLILRIQYETSNNSNKNDSTDRYKIYQKSVLSARADWIFSWTKSFISKFRLGANRLNYNGYYPVETGLSGYAHLEYKIGDLIKLGCRGSYYSTDSFESAIYEYEGLVPGVLSTQLMFGDGFKFFAFANIKPSDNLSLWVIWSYLERYNVNELGSGPDKVLMNNQKKITLQLDIKI